MSRAAETTSPSPSAHDGNAHLEPVAMQKRRIATRARVQRARHRQYVRRLKHEVDKLNSMTKGLEKEVMSLWDNKKRDSVGAWNENEELMEQLERLRAENTRLLLKRAYSCKNGALRYKLKQLIHCGDEPMQNASGSEKSDTLMQGGEDSDAINALAQIQRPKPMRPTALLGSQKCDRKDADTADALSSLDMIRCVSAPVFDSWSSSDSFSIFSDTRTQRHAAADKLDSNTSPEHGSSSGHSNDGTSSGGHSNDGSSGGGHSNDGTSVSERGKAARADRAFSRFAIQSSAHSIGDVSLCSSDNGASSDGSQNAESPTAAVRSIVRARGQAGEGCPLVCPRPVASREWKSDSSVDSTFALSSGDFFREIGRPVSVPPEMLTPTDFSVLGFSEEGASFPCSRSMAALYQGVYESKTFTEDVCRLLDSTS